MTHGATSDDSARLILREGLGIARSAFPVLGFLPLPLGRLREPTIELTDDRGFPLGSHNRALAHWPDGSIRWLAFEAALNLSPNQEKVLTARTGQAARTPAHSRLSWRSEDAVTTVISGPLWIHCEKEGGFPSLEIRHDLNEDQAFDPLERRIGPMRPEHLWVEDPLGSLHRPPVQMENGARRGAACLLPNFDPQQREEASSSPTLHSPFSILRASPYSLLTACHGWLGPSGERPVFRYHLGVETWAAKPFVRLLLVVERPLAEGGGEAPGQVGASAPRQSMGVRAGARHSPAGLPAGSVPQAIHLDLPTAFALQGVRMDDPASPGEVLDVLLDPGERLKVEFQGGRNREVALVAPAAAAVAGGGSGRPWFDVGDLFTGFSVGVLDSGPGVLETWIERQRLAFHFRPSRIAGSCWWWEIALGFHKLDRLEDIVGFAPVLLDLPILALPEWSAAETSEAVPEEWAALKDQPELARELEEEIVGLDDDAPGAQFAVVSSLVALRRTDPGTWRKAGRRLRRAPSSASWAEPSGPAYCLPASACRPVLRSSSATEGGSSHWPARAEEPPGNIGDAAGWMEGAGILAAMASWPEFGFQAHEDSRSGAPPYAAELDALARTFRDDPRPGAWEEVVERYHRLRVTPGWPELKLMLLARVHHLAIRTGLELDRLPASLFHVLPSEKPFLVRPEETRAITLVVQGKWDAPQQADLFSIVEKPFDLSPMVQPVEIGSDPSAVRFALSCGGRADAARERWAALEVSFPEISGHAPGARFRVVRCEERVGVMGEIPRLLQDRLARAGLGLACILLPWAVSVEDYDLLILGRGEAGAAGSLLRAVQAGVPCLLVDVDCGVWVPDGPLMISIGTEESRVDSVAKAGGGALSASGALRGLLGSRVGRPAVGLGSFWQALATCPDGRVACAEAEARGWVGLAQCRPMGRAAHRFYAALLDRALDAAGL